VAVDRRRHIMLAPGTVSVSQPGIASQIVPT
jgi:hypothetical protein